jgi:GntR family transcriptional regulator, transcriptional repressor for pyruvate dehydrogenase complex
LLIEIEDRRAYLIDHHRLIFDTLASHDADRADQVMRAHFAIGDEYRRRRAMAAPHQPSHKQEDPA